MVYLLKYVFYVYLVSIVFLFPLGCRDYTHLEDAGASTETGMDSDLDADSTQESQDKVSPVE